MKNNFSKYIAIGHWYDNSNTTSVASCSYTKKNFMCDLVANGFRAYVVLTEKTFNEMKAMDCFELIDKVQKLTSNYRKWNDVIDYIEQCADIIDSKLANVEC